MPAQGEQVAPEQLPLIPETPEATRKPRGSAITEPSAPTKEKKTKTEIAANEMQDRIHFRQAKTKALQDPALQADWDVAHRTRTDYERREALKEFYKKLYGRMAALDPSIKKLIETERQKSIHKLQQTRVAATEPFERADSDQ